MRGRFAARSGFALTILLCAHAFVAPDVRAQANVLRRVYCEDAPRCEVTGKIWYDFGDGTSALESYSQEVGYLEAARRECIEGATHGNATACKWIPPQPYNNAAIALLKNGQPLKARAWLTLAPKSGITDFNAALIQHALAGFKWPPTPEGRYWKYAGNGVWDELFVMKDSTSYDVSLFIYNFPDDQSSSLPHLLTIAGTTAIVNDVALIKGERANTCSAIAKLSTDHAVVEAQGECAADQRKNIAGVYQRVSVPTGSTHFLEEHFVALDPNDPDSTQYVVEPTSEELRVHLTLRNIRKVTKEINPDHVDATDIIFESEVIACNTDPGKGYVAATIYEDRVVAFTVSPSGQAIEDEDSPYLWRPMVQRDFGPDSQYASIARKYCPPLPPANGASTN